MKFGICTGFEINDGKVNIPHIGFIKSCGFDYVELALNRIVGLTDKEFLSLKDYLRQNSIPCLACNCFMGPIPITGPNCDLYSLKTYIEKAVKLAAELGCEKLVLGSGGSRNVPTGFDMEKAEKQLDSCIDFIISQVEKYGITLIIEHLNKSESNIVTTFRESAEMSQTKNNPAFRTILDTYHFCLGGESTALISQYKEQIGHIHFARTLGRTYPCVNDFPSLKPILSAIKETGYNNTFSMECSFPKMEEEPEEYREVLVLFKNFFNLSQ